MIVGSYFANSMKLSVGDRLAISSPNDLKKMRDNYNKKNEEAILPDDYTVTAHKIVTRCSDLGCEHERVIVNGAILNTDPLKIMLISEPGTGRAWRKLTAQEAAEHATRALAVSAEW